MTAKQREEFLLKERLRLQKLRAAKQPPQNPSRPSNVATLSRSTQSLGKAVKRARTSLPKSPQKQRRVVSELAESVGLKLVRPCPYAHGSTLSDETIKLVYECMSFIRALFSACQVDRMCI